MAMVITAQLVQLVEVVQPVHVKLHVAWLQRKEVEVRHFREFH